ncbi:MAG: hypothetical protein FWD28_08295 [Treponema sp.]|nr:hypothetical protein [Treponema sp.]
MLGIIFLLILIVFIVLFVLFLIVAVMFILSSGFLIINTVNLIKGKLKRKIFIVLPAVGLIASIFLFMPFFNLYTAVKDDQVKNMEGRIDIDRLKTRTDVDTILFWENEVLLDGEIIKYFVYENKKYYKYAESDSMKLDVLVPDKGTERTVALIIDEIQIKNNFLGSLFNVVFKDSFGGPSNTVRYYRIYSLKNYSDFSFLLVSQGINHSIIYYSIE